MRDSDDPSAGPEAAADGALASAFGTCRACQAQVDRRARYCPVCGVVAPLSALRHARARLAGWPDIGAVIGGAVGVWAGATLGSLLSSLWQAPGWQSLLGALALPCSIGAGALLGYNSRRHRGAAAGAALGAGLALIANGAFKAWLAASAGAILGAALSVVAGVYLGRRYIARWGQEVVDARQPRSLLETAAQLARRIAQLDASAARMTALQAQVAQGIPADRAAPVLAALAAAQQATQRQRDRLQVEAWRVELARWQNQLQPALAVWRRLGDREAEAAQHSVRHAQQQLAQWQAEWGRAAQGQTEPGLAVLAHAVRLQQACAQLSQVLLVRQAIALAQGSPGAADAFGTPAVAADALEQLDLLRSRRELGDYLQSAGDARDEVQRLQAEQEAIAEVERLLHRPALAGR